MGYYIDFREISINNFRSKLEIADLVPSRMLLKENLTERFEFFKERDIKNVLQLQQTLKKKGKIEEFARTGPFNENYLKVLLREINSLQPKPCKIEAFANISPDTISKLYKAGIKNTIQLFDLVKTVSDRKELSIKEDIPEEEIILLARLTDLNRVRWVGANFARMLYDSGYGSANELAKADDVVLHRQINQLNKELGIYKGVIGLHDMKLCIEAAKEVSVEIEF